MISMPRIQFNYHRKTGITPGFSVSHHYYGADRRVFVVRIWWSAVTVAIQSQYKKA